MRKLIAILAVTSAATLLACDPFNKEPGGAPAVLSGFASVDMVNNITAIDGSAPTAAGAVAITGVPSDCFDAPDGSPPHVPDTGAPSTIFVKFNKLLDGASIQAGENDCTPAAGVLTTATPAAPAGSQYYVCYNPSSPTPTEGSSIVIFQAAATGAAGWDGADGFPASPTATATFHFAGTVKDKGGASVAFDVTAAVDPNPNPGNLLAPSTGSSVTITDGAAGSGAVTVDWTAANCATATTNYILERAPNFTTGTTDAAGATSGTATTGTAAGVDCTVAAPCTCTVADPCLDNYAPISSGTAQTFGDSGLTTGTKYWYRVNTESAAGAADGATGAAFKHTAP
jgi:hypothetical protein